MGDDLAFSLLRDHVYSWYLGREKSFGSLEGIDIRSRVYPANPGTTYVTEGDVEYLGAVSIIIAGAVKVQFIKMIRIGIKIELYFPDETKKEIHSSCGARAHLGSRYCPNCGEFLRKKPISPSAYKGAPIFYPINSKTRRQIELVVLEDYRELRGHIGFNPWGRSLTSGITEEAGWEFNLKSKMVAKEMAERDPNQMNQQDPEAGNSIGQ